MILPTEPTTPEQEQRLEIERLKARVRALETIIENATRQMADHDLPSDDSSDNHANQQE
jgi:hypothetical protein